MTKDERKQLHRDKMQIKRLKYEEARERVANRPQWVQANLGVNHPDYGASPQQHEAEKSS